LAVNELAKIQEEAGDFNAVLRFTPEMVPIVKLECGDQPQYCIDNDCFQKMLKSENISVEDGIGKLFDEIESDPENDIETTCEMCILLREENIDALYETVTSDPAKLSMRCESITNHIDYIKAIQSTGCNVYFV
jgi:hypothetical protein